MLAATKEGGGGNMVAMVEALAGGETGESSLRMHLHYQTKAPTVAQAHVHTRTFFIYFDLHRPDAC